MKIHMLTACISVVSLNHLNGKVALLDFFTYCCINCLHILPDLDRLEEAGVAVVGVHSAKFDNERVAGQVERAVERYNIRHPVCEDRAGALWGQLGVTCWPTQLILSPAGHPVWVAMGETHGPWLEELCRLLLQVWGEVGLLSGPPLPISLGSTVSSRLLSYPGKVAVCGRQLAVADTGHHRLLLVDRESGL